jgi:hypothetical protein
MSKVLATFPKQPGETLDFDISFEEWLAARTDTLSSHEVSADEGITVEFSSANNGVVKVWLSGGENGRTYKVTARIETAGGRIKEGDIAIKVKELGRAVT